MIIIIIGGNSCDSLDRVRPAAPSPESLNPAGGLLAKAGEGIRSNPILTDQRSASSSERRADESLQLQACPRRPTARLIHL